MRLFALRGQVDDSRKFQVRATRFALRLAGDFAPLLVVFPEAANLLHWLCEVGPLFQRSDEQRLQSGVSGGETAPVLHGFFLLR